MRSQKKGFSLMELMIVIGILAIISSVILVNMNNAKNKSRDNAVFSKMMKVVAPSLTCLRSGITGARLSNASDSTNFPNKYICYKGLGTVNELSDYPKWPDITTENWTYTANFNWCNLGYTGESAPQTGAGLCSSGHGTTCGYNSLGSGQFCFRIKNASKYVWCTENGCKKQGF